MLAAFRLIAGGLATVYAELVSQGVPPIHAATITARMGAAQITSARPTDTGESGGQP